jgi:hypothetical protein
VNAVLCAVGPVRVLAGSSVAPENRRGYSALYDAVNAGLVDIVGLRWSLACLHAVSSWLRPDPATSPERLSCHVYGRGKAMRRLILGWPYSPRWSRPHVVDRGAGRGRLGGTITRPR